jgi:hypothetical protein
MRPRGSVTMRTAVPLSRDTVEQARVGTLFVDDIAEPAPSGQAQLLWLFDDCLASGHRVGFPARRSHHRSGPSSRP